MPINVISLVQVNEEEPEALAHYLEVAQRLIDGAGGRIVSRFPIGEARLGRGAAQTVIVTEYPDRDAIAAMFASPEYRAMLPVRERAFHAYRVSVTSNGA